MNCELRKTTLTKGFQAIFKSLPASNCNTYLGVNTLLKKSMIIMTNIQKTTQEGYRNTPQMHTVLYTWETNLPKYYVNWLSLKVAFKIILNIHYKRKAPTHW